MNHNLLLERAEHIDQMQMTLIISKKGSHLKKMEDPVPYIHCYQQAQTLSSSFLTSSN